MTLQETIAIFTGLPIPLSQDTSPVFSAVPFDQGNPHRLAKDHSGAPCLLLATVHSAPSVRPPLALQNISVVFDLLCKIHLHGTTGVRATFTVIKCVSPDATIQGHFLSFVPLISTALRAITDRTRIQSIVDDMVELFRVLSAPPRKEIQGLWGELFLISESLAPAELLSAWHSEPTDTYDFNTGPQRVEVKTTVQSPRSHHFSLDQLLPPADTSIVIASLVVRRSGAGACVSELLSAIFQRSGVAPELQLQATMKAHQVLGSSWQAARDTRFDIEAARQSLRYYDSGAIPKVQTPLPAGLSCVSFIVDMEPVHTLTSAELVAAGGLRSVLPASPSRNKHSAF